MRIGRSLSVVVAGALLGIPAAPAAAAVSAAQHCEAAIETASSKYAACRLNAESRYTKTSNGAVYASKLASCQTKLSVAYVKAFARYGGSCPTVEPASAFDAYLAQCTIDVAAAAAGGTFATGSDPCGNGTIETPEQCDGGDLGGASCTSLGYTRGGTLGCDAGCGYDTSACASQAYPASGQTTAYGTGSDGDVQAGAPLAYTDNGDGTITDDNTGLMWEKKSDDGSVHDYNNAYTWWNGVSFTPLMNGTIRTVFLATLNDVGGGGASCFAGHCDWRIPNVKELQSIVDYGSSPPVDPVFRSGCAPGCTVLTCSCTASGYNVSSSTNASVPGDAWSVDFGNGTPYGGTLKHVGVGVRAVRGGA